MYTVTVLTPRGRRQQVKVTPNTTLLQILEEVCSEQGFKAEEYDLRHHNKVLDISSMFRFTSLPNNAQLEMTEAVKQRQESPVTLGLQLESGERLTGVFSPSETIWNVITSLKPDEKKSVNLVVIYMRQEIFGNENLKATTLRSLGLTGGRAILRLLHKSPEELRIQANVSTNLLPRLVLEKPLPTDGSKSPESTKSETPPSPKPDNSAMDSFKKETPKEKPKSPSLETAKTKAPPSKSNKVDLLDFRGNLFEKLLKDEGTRKELLESKKNKETKESSTHKESVSSEPKSKMSPKLKMKTSGETHVSKSVNSDDNDWKEEKKVILLGDRNAVAYNLNNVKPVVFEEEPDDFYDLTLNDAKLLLKHAKQLCADLEDAPLMTAAQRELERDKKLLTLLNQYKKTVLRVKFPDRTVLQGTFSSVETISSVEKFVSDYLENPHLKFYLYTTPPKVILKPEERLIECGCVPCSILYFGISSNATPPTQFLKSDVLEKLSTPSAAALTAYQSRGMDKKADDKTLPEEAEKRKWPKNTNNPEPGPSGHKPRDQESSPQFKVPKWFKTNK